MAKNLSVPGLPKPVFLTMPAVQKLKKYRQRHNIISNILQRKKYNPIQKMKNTRRMELNPLWKAF